MFFKLFYPLGNALYYSNNMEFSTFDADHDNHDGGNFAEYFRGANWWNRCGANNINGPLYLKNINNDRFIWWKDGESSYSF